MWQNTVAQDYMYLKIGLYINYEDTNDITVAYIRIK